MAFPEPPWDLILDFRELDQFIRKVMMRMEAWMNYIKG